MSESTDILMSESTTTPIIPVSPSNAPTEEMKSRESSSGKKVLTPTMGESQSYSMLVDMNDATPCT